MKYVDRNCPYYYEEVCREHGTYFRPECTVHQMKDNTCIDCSLYKFPEPHTSVEEMRAYFHEQEILSNFKKEMYG